VRALHKSWQDKPSGWTRRVRWYQGPYDIRLHFEDEVGSANEFYVEPDAATEQYQRFRNGERGATVYSNQP